MRDSIRFRTPVRRVDYDAATGLFNVTAQDLASDDETTESFDYVVVATGHFSTPNVPHFGGLDRFNGRVLHAHDFRDAVEFKDKDILIIGTSYSAEDIGSQCWKYGCKSVTVSHRTAAMGYDWPDNWREVPPLQKVVGNTCTFKGGSTADVDAIVLCTGYLHHFPFMASELRLKSANRLAAAELYKGVVWVDNPKLFYLGMQDQWYTFNMFDAQAWYVPRHHHGPHPGAGPRNPGRRRCRAGGQGGCPRRRLWRGPLSGQLCQGTDRRDRLSQLRRGGRQRGLLPVEENTRSRTS